MHLCCLFRSSCLLSIEGAWALSTPCSSYGYISSSAAGRDLTGASDKILTERRHPFTTTAEKKSLREVTKERRNLAKQQDTSSWFWLVVISQVTDEKKNCPQVSIGGWLGRAWCRWVSGSVQLSDIRWHPGGPQSIVPQGLSQCWASPEQSHIAAQDSLLDFSMRVSVARRQLPARCIVENNFWIDLVF